MQLFERLCTTFFTHNAPLVSDGGYYSSEDVFTALPYAKGRRYFDAVPRTQRTAKNSFGCFGGSVASDVPRPSAATANGRCILQNTFMPMCLRTLPINEYVEKLRGFTTSYSTYSLFYRLPLPLRLNEFCEVTSKCGRRLGRF